MAGAPAGGAELFFERLTAALHRAGDAVLPVIRRDPARAARLAGAGLHPGQLRFGGPLDLLTRFSAAGATVPSFGREWGDVFTRTATPALRVPDFHMSSVSEAL